MTLFSMLLLLFLMLCGFSNAFAAEECLRDVWKGTIGDVPVMMQFGAGSEDNSLAGRYYYRTSLIDLILVRDDKKPDRWKEMDPKGKVSGYLTLSCNDGALSGVWSSRDGSKTMPIKAHAESTGSYSGHRMGSLKITGKRGSIGSFTYETMRAQGCNFVGGLRLAGESPAVAEINRTLRSRFTEKLEEGIDCIATGRMTRDDDSYSYEYSMEMIAWNKAFVVIGDNMSNYCGGMHPEVQSAAVVYNLQSGKPEAVSQWFGEKYRESIPKKSALGKIIMEAYRSLDVRIFPTKTVQVDPEECLEAIDLYSEAAWPTSKGVTFRPTTDYSQSACIVDITVPYKKLISYLSATGKEKIKSFQTR